MCEGGLRSPLLARANRARPVIPSALALLPRGYYHRNFGRTPDMRSQLISFSCAAANCEVVSGAFGDRAGVERSVSIASRSWVEFVKLAGGLGVVYFLAARLGFFLRAEPRGAVFWPAAGIAAGALIALGPSARLAIATAAFTATLTLNLVVGRSPWLTIAFSLISAGHPLLTAWLIECWFGDRFKLED